jgi:hypothetical protein
LAVEIEISRSALDRTGIYAALGVREVWRFDAENLYVEQLQPDGAYVEFASSVAFPFLPLNEVVRWIDLADTFRDQSEWGRRLREWVRNELATQREEPKA